MTDNFALLNEPRRPWLDPELLKAKFLTLSSELHPDRIHNASETEKSVVTKRYTALNAAFNCLREPKERLLHLLELERGVKPAVVQSIPAGTVNLFSEVAQLCREANAFLAEKNNVTSPLLKVQMFERGQEWTDKLNALQQKLSAWRDELTVELKSMNAGWESPTNSRRLNRLEELYRHFSFITRWMEQIREKLVQLSF
jgi:hypothetical protein